MIRAKNVNQSTQDVSQAFVVYRWRAAGVWDRILAALQAEAEARYYAQLKPAAMAA